MIRYAHRIYPSLCRQYPEDLFVFGDNMQQIGGAGQAVIRAEGNAVGIPTKWEPSMKEGAFFTDADYETVAPTIKRKFAILEAHLQRNGTVWWPADGIGTGLAQLPQRAPAIFALIQDKITALEWQHGKLVA